MTRYLPLIAVFLCLVACQPGDESTEPLTGQPSYAVSSDGAAEQRNEASEQPVTPESAQAAADELASDGSVAPPDPGMREATPAAPGASRILSPADGIEVDPDQHIVRLSGFVCIDAGWLEQIACSPDTREYEALVVLPQAATDIHAALLMAGFESGRPGGWSWNEERNDVDFIEPRGSLVRVEFEYLRDSKTVRDPARLWIRDHLRRQQFPDKPWVFGGSAWEENNEWMKEQTGRDEHYVADMTGSIIGLVTFGD